MIKFIALVLILLIKFVSSNDQLINFVPETEDFDLMASESINDQYSNVFDLTTDDYLKECLEAHNQKRKLHGSDDLIYDEKLLNDAKEAEFQSAMNGKLTRIEDSAYGENLAASTKRLTCRNAVNLWYRQNVFYNYHVPLYTKETGGFTQLVWRETRRFACAQARLKTGGSGYFTACLYDPFGNVSGQFRANVLPIQANASVLQSSHKTTISANNNQVSPISSIVTAIPTAAYSKPMDSKFVSNIENDNNNTVTETTADLHEVTLNVSPHDPNEPAPRTTTLVKPIMNKARLSPAMLVKLKHLNKRRQNVSNVAKENTIIEKIETSASELNLTYIRSFVQNNSMPTLNTMEISNIINRNQNDTLADSHRIETLTNYSPSTSDETLFTVRSI